MLYGIIIEKEGIMKANYHTHTYRCLHASNVADELYVKEAINAGFDILAFTDHVPYPWIRYLEEHQDRMSYSEMDEYLQMIYTLKKRYQDKIDILSGFEIEYYPEYKDHYQRLRKKSDILILGQHNRYPLIHDYGVYNNDNDVFIYATQICDAIATGFVDILAHPDYFMLGRSAFNDACIKASHMIAHQAALYDIPLEINLNGLRYGKKLIDHQEVYPYPCRDFWQIAKQYDCKAVYGYDAHDPSTLSQSWRIDEVNRVLAGLDIKIIDKLGR